MKIQLITKISIVSTVLLLLLIFSFDENNNDNDFKDNTDEISSKLTNQFKNNTNKVIVFNEITDFYYDKVCIFRPYTNNEYAESKLGFKWDIEEKTNININDGINIIVFIKNNKVLTYFKHRRDEGDFSKHGGKCLKYNESLNLKD